jgi:putative ATPase
VAERAPRRTQRLYALVDSRELDAGLIARWRQAEEAIYTDPADPLVNWDEDDLRAALTAAGLSVRLQGESEQTAMSITPATLQRWFTPTDAGKPAYCERLATLLTDVEIGRIRHLFERQLTGQPILWQTYTVFLTAQ